MTVSHARAACAHGLKLTVGNKTMFVLPMNFSEGMLSQRILPISTAVLVTLNGRNPGSAALPAIAKEGDRPAAIIEQHLQAELRKQLVTQIRQTLGARNRTDAAARARVLNML